MIVRLTVAQYQTCYAYASAAAKAWLDDGTPVSKTMWDVPMPPIGWRLLLQAMTEDAYNAYGQRAGRAKGSLHRAIKRIAHSLAHLEAHPAFNGQALPGEHDTFFTAWRKASELSPYPNDGDAVGLLPEWRTIGGIRVTTWYEYYPNGWAAPMYDPGSHLALIEQARSDATES